MTRARDLADYIATGVSDTELDILDGLTSTTAELNILDGVTSTATELNILDGATVTVDEVNILDGVTSTAAELNILDGVTSTAAELNILDGVTATTAELNYVDGVTSSIQTQMNNLAGSATIAVTVVNSGGNKYAIDGTVQQLTLITPSVTYRFDQSHSSNSGHPLRLSTTSDGSHASGSAFTTGVTAVGTPGSAGAYTEVKLEQDAPDTLYYYCTNHSGMGGEVDVRATVSSLSDLSITSTAAELNILDGVTSTAAELNILDGVTTTAAEINLIDGDTSRGTTAVADGDGFLTNDGGTMRMTKVDTLATYMQNKIIGGTSIVTTGALDSGSITSGFGTINTGASAITTTGAITGGSFVIGSADINENDLESIDGITAGTVAASKAAIVDANKDITGFRNVTLTGELDAATLDISGAIDVAGNSVLASVDVTGVATAATFEPDGDTAAGDNAAIGYTSAEGLILTGQGSTSDITLKNDADATVFTVPTGTDDILFPDSAKAMFGAGSDLKVYHDGSNSYVQDSGTGNLIIAGDGDIQITDAAVSENKAVFSTNGAATLYYNNAAKIATTSGGVNVTGIMDADNFKINGAQGTDGQVLTSTGSGVAFEDAAGGIGGIVNSSTLSSAAAAITVSGFTETFDEYRIMGNFVTGTSTKYVIMKCLDSNGNAIVDSDGGDPYFFTSGFAPNTSSAQEASNTHFFIETNQANCRLESNRTTQSTTNGGLVELIAFFPRNDSRHFSFHAKHHKTANPHFYYGVARIPLNAGDVHGVTFSLSDGSNFDAGSYAIIYSVAKS